MQPWLSAAMKDPPTAADIADYDLGDASQGGCDAQAPLLQELFTSHFSL